MASYYLIGFVACLVSVVSAQGGKKRNLPPSFPSRAEISRLKGSSCILRNEWAQLPLSLQHEVAGYAMEAIDDYPQGPKTWTQYRVRFRCIFIIARLYKQEILRFVSGVTRISEESGFVAKEKRK